MSHSHSARKGPKFICYFWPLIKALKALGGSGRPAEVFEQVAKSEGITEKEQQERLKSGGSRFANQIYFSKQYLLWAGFVASSERGVWALTDAGNALKEMSHEKALEIFKQQHALHQTKTTSKPEAEAEEDEAEDLVEGYEQNILDRLQALTPKGFEHFCKRILREYGFERVVVTGGPKDRGLDGNGILKVNPFMSFTVAFQCKKYADPVTSNHISTFRGSIPASIDKGIMITTSYFTADAIQMAQNTGHKPIELIDGKQLVELMKKLELGLKPTYVVDEMFFGEFENKE
jgi:restriction system protein